MLCAMTRGPHHRQGRQIVLRQSVFQKALCRSLNRGTQLACTLELGGEHALFYPLDTELFPMPLGFNDPARHQQQRGPGLQHAELRIVRNVRKKSQRQAARVQAADSFSVAGERR